ncbi:hypothetical protein LR48_Vigan03g197800 [Vigna angularis]|uniref:Uncharacterized protein n=1 Tax=Phaseolus angularis TaxID=3914 RepID=A0A0L9U764_PHAAN|nr:uncharacterized protein HKW66_Vig0046570 [Vigna angularis]KOM38596.1 hypothetical protein LR48_Vigan03g197800 [Vigna angularis]
MLPALFLGRPNLHCGPFGFGEMRKKKNRNEEEGKLFEGFFSLARCRLHVCLSLRGHPIKLERYRED